MIQVDSTGQATLTTNYRDTVYDALAASNRISRATYQAVMGLQTLLTFALIMIVIYLYRNR